MPGGRGLRERLSGGEDVLIAEGYIYELEKRGYIKAGHYVPEVAVKFPHLLEQLHQEFVHAGSDVTQAFTYYCNRHKIQHISDTGIDLEDMYIKALNIARKVSQETDTLLAGDIGITGCYQPNNSKKIEEAKEMFKEQAEWISTANVDYVVLETFGYVEEARLALDTCKRHLPNVPLVVTFSVRSDTGLLDDGVTVWDACATMEREGADVVGVNCARGPNTMIPLLEEIRKTCKGPIAALPVPYRTSEKYKTFQQLKLDNGRSAIPEDMEEFAVGRTTIAEFTKKAKAIGVQYFGICCGNTAAYTRKMAEALGRQPSASRYSPDMSTHDAFYNQTTSEDVRNLYAYQL